MSARGPVGNIGNETDFFDPYHMHSSTRELNNDQVTNHPSGIANDSRGHESEPPGAPSVHFSHAQSQHDHQIEEMESHGNEEYAVPYSPSRHHRR